jgi:hypothetical protein
MSHRRIPPIRTCALATRRVLAPREAARISVPIAAALAVLRTAENASSARAPDTSPRAWAGHRRPREGERAASRGADRLLSALCLVALHARVDLLLGDARLGVWVSSIGLGAALLLFARPAPISFYRVATLCVGSLAFYGHAIALPGPRHGKPMHRAGKPRHPPADARRHTRLPPGRRGESLAATLGPVA